MSRFRDEDELAPWLHRITVSICLDFLRHSKRNASIAETIEAVDRAINPEQALSRAHQRALIQAALDTLSERERMAIVLRDLEGSDNGESAIFVVLTARIVE